MLTLPYPNPNPNYLAGSIVAQGLDPANLPESDPSKMNFEEMSGGSKAWKDVWGAGQGVGAIKEVKARVGLVSVRVTARVRVRVGIRVRANPTPTPTLTLTRCPPPPRWSTGW